MAYPINNSSSSLYTSFAPTVQFNTPVTPLLQHALFQRGIFSTLPLPLSNIYASLNQTRVIESLSALQMQLNETTQQQLQLAKIDELIKSFPRGEDALFSSSSISPSPLLPCPGPFEDPSCGSQNLLSQSSNLSLTSESTAESSSTPSDLFPTGTPSMLSSDGLSVSLEQYVNSDSSSSSSSSSSASSIPSKKRKLLDEPGELQLSSSSSSSTSLDDDFERCRQSAAELGSALKKLREDAQELTAQIEILKMQRKDKLERFNAICLELKSKNLAQYLNEDLDVLITPEQAGFLKVKQVFDEYRRAVGFSE